MIGTRSFFYSDEIPDGIWFAGQQNSLSWNPISTCLRPLNMLELAGDGRGGLTPTAKLADFWCSKSVSDWSIGSLATLAQRLLTNAAQIE